MISCMHEGDVIIYSFKLNDLSTPYCKFLVKRLESQNDFVDKCNFKVYSSQFIIRKFQFCIIRLIHFIYQK